MRSQHFPVSFEEFELLPRRPGWKYEYWDGQAHISPRHQSVSVALRGNPATAATACLLRPVAAADQGQLASAYVEAFRDSIEYCDWTDARIEEQAREGIERFFGGRRGQPLAASRLAMDGSPDASKPSVLGAALLVQVAPGTALLDLLFVVPSRQRQGLATALVSAAVQELRARRIHRFESRYHLGNEASRAWHRRFGFVEEPDLFLAQSMVHHFRHEIRRRERLDDLPSEERASLEAECERWRAQLAELEGLSTLRRPGQIAVPASIPLCGGRERV